MNITEEIQNLVKAIDFSSFSEISYNYLESIEKSQEGMKKHARVYEKEESIQNRVADSTAKSARDRIKVYNEQIGLIKDYSEKLMKVLDVIKVQDVELLELIRLLYLQYEAFFKQGIKSSIPRSRRVLDKPKEKLEGLWNKEVIERLFNNLIVKTKNYHLTSDKKDLLVKGSFSTNGIPITKFEEFKGNVKEFVKNYVTFMDENDLPVNKTYPIIFFNKVSEFNLITSSVEKDLLNELSDYKPGVIDFDKFEAISKISLNVNDLIEQLSQGIDFTNLEEYYHLIIISLFLIIKRLYDYKLGIGDEYFDALIVLKEISEIQNS